MVSAAPPSPRPKRKYTATLKVLAANRANLLKANAVDKAIRFCATPKRLAACRRNLLKALGFWERRRRGTAPLRIPATANAEVAAWLPGQGAALSAVRRRSETQVLPGSVFGFGSKGSNLNIRPEPGFGGEVNQL